ncbi:MAG: TIGR03118 family protein [Acidobacteriia bacterium]|nr:TIGR03118 family protein [Terriglobia bacterium]
MTKASLRLLYSLAVLCCTSLLIPNAAFAQHYIQTNLVSDLPGMAAVKNPNLVNPWGLARSTGSPWWVSDNGAGVSSLYDGTGTPRSLVVTIPPPPKGSAPSAPTGVVFNGSPDFVISKAKGGDGKPASFIFVTEDGTIAAWDGGAGTNAVLLVDHSPDAVYKGCTTADIKGVRYLYVANFRSGRIEVYDTNFNPVDFSGDRDHYGDHDKDDHDGDHDRDDHYGDHDRDNHDGPFSRRAFDDDRIPQGFAPFNVQNIGGSLFVTYAKQDATKHDDDAGPGNGFVDIYSPSGRLETRLQHGDWLNSPWGVVWTPRDFGEFSNRVLVGNFGSGEIAAYDGFTGRFVGLVKTYDDPVALTGEHVLTIDGLWSLTFGNSAKGVSGTGAGSAGPYNSLFFTAGINHEQDGLFGTLTAVTAEQDGDEE